jgi:hypothetical protein
MVRFRKVFVFAAVVTAVLALRPADALSQQGAPAPRENLMKACGDKWRAVRETETAKGVTWPQFLSRCRSETSGSARIAPAPSGASDAAARTRPAEKPRATGKGPVFPVDIAPRHASERPALARQRTCADQFKANKASDANGGLRWIEKGGGYWSRCNAHLKQTRA